MLRLGGHNILTGFNWTYDEWGLIVKRKSDKPDIWSCDLVSSAQIYVWAHSDAPPSSERGPRTPVGHSALCHSCHLQPTEPEQKSRESQISSEKDEIKKNAWKETPLTFCASSCLSKLTKPNPLDLPLSSVITLILRAGPSKQAG